MTAEYGVPHADWCPSGDRAEVRGPCSCGSQDERPWRVREVSQTDASGKPMVELVVLRALTTREAVELSLTLQELTRQIGERWGRREMKANKPTKEK